MIEADSTWITARPGPWPRLRRLVRAAVLGVHILGGWCLAFVTDAFRRPRRRLVRRVTRWWLRTALVLLPVEVRVRGTPAREPALLVSNHVSWLDIPVLGAQSELCFLSKQEVRHWPWIGPLAMAADTLFIRRGRDEVRHRRAEIAQQLFRGRSVLVFPEGTTTDGRRVARFHGHLLTAAEDAGVPLQPVTLRYRTRAGEVDTDVAFLGADRFHRHVWRLLLRNRIRVDVIFHQPRRIAVSDSYEQAGAMAARARSIVAGDL